ncbi:MAG: Na(+)/H(+) antiporter subunit D, partial [Verrucomicrobiota bacterium]
MTDSLSHPSLTLIVGSLLVPFLPGKLRNGYLVLLPIFALAQLLLLPFGTHGEFELFGMSLTAIRLDKLSFIFCLIFLIAAIVNAIYAIHVKDNLQHVAALLYEGAAIGAVLAGDTVTLFVYWELTAIASVFLIWARRTERAYRTGIRYLLVQVASGVFLLIGAILNWNETGSIAFDAFDLSLTGSKFILLAFGIKCAFPLLHSWLQDAYPEATITGTVVLSAFTTKLAVYALARGFAGTEFLITIGAIMVVFPIFYAIIENDLRRVLAFSLNDQLGFMVVGIGIGTELALNGAAAHAFCHILYKALLFMSMGAVFLRTGTVKASDLGGLAEKMPWTTGFCCVGAASISAFPLFCGFISKTMIITAAAEAHLTFVWLLLLLSSAGAIHYCGFKLPWFAFFQPGPERNCKEAPKNMLAAMGIAAFFCVILGLFPGLLYALLPYE